MTAPATVETLLAQPAEIAAEALSASEWARLLDITVQAFAREGVADCGTRRNHANQLARIYRFAALPARWREQLGEAKRRHGVAWCRDLLDIAERANAWTPPKRWSELPPGTRERATKVREVMLAYYTWLDQGLSKKDANLRAQALWLQVFGSSCTEKTIRNWERRLEERGAKYLGAGNLRPEAFCDGKSCEHRRARKEHPEAFRKWFASQFLDARKGVPSLGAIYDACLRTWERGEEIPGLGMRSHPSEAFPYTRNQLRPLMPPRVVREIAGRGKFLAKTGGYLAAPPLDWSNVEPMRVVMFDDKVLDLQVLTDDGTRSFRPVVYIAYCAGTRRILAYIVREEGHTRQLDVEGLMAAVISQHGIGGPEAGWPTVLKIERGTIAMSEARRRYLEMMFAGRLQISVTSMVGGRNHGGDFAQSSSGNFMGKGVIEALMASIDIFGKATLPGATGHRYDRQPAMLGDTTLTLEKLINSARLGNKASRSLLDESITTAALARLLDWVETGEARTAREASEATGIKPPALYYGEFVAVLGELFRAHNHRRGHRMQGFATVRVPHPDPGIAATGRVLEVAESPMDKAARMFDAMALAGRRLMRPDDADIVALLHKVARVTVRAKGGVTLDGVRYWSPDSRAIAEAAGIQGGAKEYLALYNPIAPTALYLLANPPSHLPRKATELPGDFTPQFLEALPAYTSPSIVDAEAMASRAEQVARFNSRAGRQLLVQAAPVLLERTQERETLKDRIEPLRRTLDQSIALRAAEPSHPPGQLPPSALATDLAHAEISAAEATTREAQREQALPTLIERLAARQRERQQPPAPPDHA